MTTGRAYGYTLVEVVISYRDIFRILRSSGFRLSALIRRSSLESRSSSSSDDTAFLSGSTFPRCSSLVLARPLLLTMGPHIKPTTTAFQYLTNIGDFLSHPNHCSFAILSAM